MTETYSIHVEIVYRCNKDDVRTVRGDLVPAGGPFARFLVVQQNDGEYLCIHDHCIITITMKTIPDLFLVSLDDMQRSKDMDKTLLDAEWKQMQNSNKEEYI